MMGAPRRASCAPVADVSAQSTNAVASSAVADFSARISPSRGLYTIWLHVSARVKPEFSLLATHRNAYLLITTGFTLRHAAAATYLHCRIADGIHGVTRPASLARRSLRRRWPSRID